MENEVSSFDLPACFLDQNVLRPGMVLLMLSNSDKKISEIIASHQYRKRIPASRVSHAGMFVEREQGNLWTLFEADDSGAGSEAPPTYFGDGLLLGRSWVVLPDAKSAYLFAHPELAARIAAHGPESVASKLSDLTGDFFEVYSNYERLAETTGWLSPVARMLLARLQRHRNQIEGAAAPRANEGVFCSEAVVAILQAMGCEAFDPPRFACTVGPGDLADSLLEPVPEGVLFATPRSMGMLLHEWRECIELRSLSRRSSVQPIALMRLLNRRLQELWPQIESTTS
ncbi:MAG: hypothetical protein JNM07_01050 [Phycisphaerae bacterium]|nr:hypothetical protein [Phycisphaerae bacterium]